MMHSLTGLRSRRSSSRPSSLSQAQVLLAHLEKKILTSASSQNHYRCYSSTQSQNQNERIVSVFWDIDNCKPNPNVNNNVSNIVDSISEAVKTTLGINKRPPLLQINAFGHIPSFTQPALSSAGVNFIGVDHGADRSPLVDWVSQNHPPAHIFLICGDSRFDGILNKLRTTNNILVAAREPAQALDDLYRPATIIWHWKDLVKSQNPSGTGTHFELLPSHFFSSWYLIYKGLYEDPFTMSEPHKSSAIEDSSNAVQSFYYRHRPVPKVVLDHLLEIFDFFPGGLTITELHSELEARNVSLDKVFYGYQKFLHFLLALPYIVDIQSRSDGQIIVRDASITILESFQRKGVSPQSMVENVSGKVLDAPSRNDEVASIEEENPKNKNVFAGNIDAENIWRFESFTDSPTEQSKQGSSVIEENSKQTDDASESKHFDVDVSNSKKLDEEISLSRRHELFNKDSFQNALLSTHPGSHVILNSASREQFAEWLRKEELSNLWSLQVNDIRQLVDFLVSDKWIKEFPTKNPRFEVAYPSEIISDSTQRQSPTGLSSVVMNSIYGNSQLKVSPFGQKKPIEKSRNEMLADCERVLDETLFHCPEYLKRKMEAIDHDVANFRTRNEMLALCEKLLDSMLTHNPDCLKKLETVDAYQDYMQLVAALSWLEHPGC